VLHSPFWQRIRQLLKSALLGLRTTLEKARALQGGVLPVGARRDALAFAVVFARYFADRLTASLPWRWQHMLLPTSRQHERHDE
jgi:hypothetical protein